MRLITKWLSAFLLLFIVGHANAAKEYEIDQRFDNLADLLSSGQLFSIVNETDGKGLCFGVGAEQDMNYETFDGMINSSKSYTFKVEAAEGDDVAGNYYLRPYKPDGTLNNVWGWGGYFNSQPATGNVCFCLGLNNQNGQDGKNLAVWAIEAQDGKFALKNIGTGKYLKDGAPAKYDEPTYYTFCTLKEKPSTDPLAEQKDALEAAIAKGKMYNAIAFTEATFGALTSAVADGEAALTAADATAESLTGAATAINNAVLALALKDGITVLTVADFKEWDSATEPTTSKETGCAFELFKPSNMVYGSSTVGLLTFADLSAYDKFFVTVSDGTPRILLNRDVNEGQWNADESQSHLIDNTLDGWHNKYFTAENNVFTVDVKQLVADKGFAHLHSIKSRAQVTVTGLYLYKEAAAAETTIIDWVAGEQNYENAQDLDGVEIALDAKTTMTCTKGTGSNGPKYYTTGSAVRTYGGNVITFKGEGITKIIITGVSGKVTELTASTGELTQDGIVTTWKGEANEIVLTNNTTNQQHIAKLHVVYGGVEADPEPVHIANTAETAYDVAKAVELIEAGEALDETVFVKGIISKIEKVNIDAEDATKSFITYWISADGTEEGQQFECYKGLSMEGLALDAIEVGAEVIVTGNLTKYNAIYEFAAGNTIVSYKAPEAPVVDEDLVEIPQDQGKTLDDFARTEFVAGEDYNTYTCTEGIQVAFKMFDIDVAGCDYVVVKFAEPVPAGWELAFWAKDNNKTVAVPAGATEYKYVFAEDESCAIANDILPQLTMLHLWTGSTPLVAKVSGIYKHKKAVQPVEAPATPTFTPAAGEYFAAQTVTIACETEGAAIYYTLDGTAPTAESALYAEPIAIAKTTTVKAIAIKDGVASEVAEAAYTITEPLFADGTYYIYNKGAQKFLAAGSSWGTHAVVNETGLDYIVAFANGKYTLDSQVSNGGNSHFLNGEWNDGAAMGWIFAAVEGKEGVYTISNGTQFLTAGEDGRVTLAADATVETAQWTLTTLEARIAELATATSEAPVNATFLIQDANFGRNDLRKSAWKMEAANQNLSGGEDGNGSVGNNCAESYHSTFALSQVIANAPAGKYKMTAQGFYRQDGSDNDNLPVFYANDKTGTFPLKTGSEGSMTDASKSFTAGNYTIEPIEFTVFEDGQLTIGAKLENNTNLWCIWDNFQLTYVTKDIPADEFEPAYTAALAAAKAAKDNESYAAVTGEEKTALEKAISDYETIAEPSADTYRAAISALTNATTAFTAAKADYEGLTAAKAAKAEFNFDAYAYAAAAKKAAAEATLTAEATSAADAKAKIGAIDKAFRQFVESNAMLEGVAGTARNCTDSIANPNAQEAIAEPWAVVKGEGSGGSLGILDGEPLTDGEGNSAYKYFDGGDWGANAWDVALEQTITLPAGKYLLTVAGRASADVDLNLFAGENTTKIAAIGAQGGLFGRGWGDASVEFEMAEAGNIKIGVRGVTSVVHNWMSFTRFRLVKFPAPEEDAPELVAPEGWVNLISNGNLAGDDVSSYVAKEYPATDPSAATIVAMIGKDNSRGILVKSQDKAKEAWDSQFWINLNQTLPAGSKLHVEFDYKADKAGSVSTQSHGNPGGYKHWACIGNVNFKGEWQHFSADVDVAADANDMQSIAFNLNDIAEANNYYFDNFGVWAQIPEPVKEWKNLIVNSDMEGDDNSCFYVTEQGVGGPFLAPFTAGIGKDGSKAVKVQSADGPTNTWDTQFFIRLPYQLPAGTKFKVSFDYKAEAAAKSTTQAHAEPGSYIWYVGIGDVNFTTEWQSFEFESVVSGDQSKENTPMQSIAFNLAELSSANLYIFDNVKFEVPEDVAATLVANPAVNPTPYPVPEVTHTWNFTKWSEATVANLKADAAASKLEGWSDVEKKADAEADGQPTEASKDNCFWAVIAEGGELTANGVVIEELKGLEFGAAFAGNRSLAIAVNYPSTSLGDYHGGAYLWLGGASFDCFVIKGVKLGTQISMGVETHKIGDARGVQLFISNADGSRGDMLKDPAGNEVAAPTAYTEQTWAVPAVEGADICDVIVYNTKGCHIYFIDAELGEGQTVGINTIAASKQFNGTIYNLRGQKMEKLQKGLNIINGKKVVK